MLPRTRLMLAALALLFVLGAGIVAQPGNKVLQSEAERVAVVNKVKPTVVAVFARGGQGGGTGVLISEDGYALTNFHVVQPTGPTMQCGLPDGVLYDAVLVGLDKVGDVALIKLLPKKDGQKFPFAVLGDSDLCREGDWSLAMGNPFLLATDFNPTITYGLISGVHRYQYPAGQILEYTDCIQIDTSINPGNSGGPLFNMKGELVGINGRGSFDKRGRINSGVGYAISINQIKNFMGHLRAGLDSDHASLGATAKTETDKSGLGRLMVDNVLEDSDVARRGLEREDQLLSFAGRPMSSVNQFKNVLGIYPRGWRLPMEFRHEEKGAQVKKEVLVRLMGVIAKTVKEGDEKPDPNQPKQPPQPKGPPSPASKFYEAKAGYANFYFNKQERDRLLAEVKKQGDFSGAAGNWVLDGGIRLKKARNESPIRLEILEEKEGGGTKSLVKFKIGEFDYSLEPLKDKQEATALRTPETSGGLLASMFVLKSFLAQPDKGFAEMTHGGYEPIYPPRTDGKAPKSLGELRVDCEVLNTRLGPYLTKFFFARDDQKLLGMELRITDNEDPCEIYFSDHRKVNNRLLPHRMQILYGDGTYGTIALTGFNLK